VNRQTTPSDIGGPDRSAPAESVRFTVIVPAYNAGRDLEQCLEALARSTYTHFDVLVVDDGSTESIKPLVDRFGYRYLRIDGPGGPARARNRGVRQTESEFVIFVDADVCVYPDTIERIMQKFAGDQDLAAVIGTYDVAPADPSFFSQYRNMFHHYTHCRSAGLITTFWAGCGAMRRDVFLKYGGFDEQRYRRPSIEDIELGTWVAADGGRIVLDRTIQCKHLKRWSFFNMVKTDVCQRGIPWIDLMLRSGKDVKTLNVTWSQRLSVALVFAACLLVVIAIWWKWAWAGAAAAAVGVTLLNIDLYRFFVSRCSLWFAARVLPLHWLYFVCCGVSILFGTVRYYASGDRASGRQLPSRSSPRTSGQKTQCHSASLSGALMTDMQVYTRVIGRSEPTRGRSRRLRLVVLFLAWFAVYHGTLAGVFQRPMPDFWWFGMDSYRLAYTKLVDSHPMAIYQFKKYPGYVAIATPLYYMARWMYRGLPEPHGENLALTFPVAMLGAANVCVAFALFRRIGFGPNSAMLPTILYASASAVWVAASFPESYVCTCLFTNLFLLAFLADPELKRWKRLAMLNAITCFFAPQQIMLAILPFVREWRLQGLPRASRRFIEYFSIVVVLFVIPLILLSMVDRKQGLNIGLDVRRGVFLFKMFTQYQGTGLENLVDVASWFVTSTTFVVFSEFAPAIRLEDFVHLTVVAIVGAGQITFLLTMAVVAYAVFGGLVARRAPPGSRLRENLLGRAHGSTIGVELIVFCVAYVAFFVYFNPQHSFAYSSPFVLPLWLLLHSPYTVHQDTRGWRLAVTAMCLVAVLNTAALLADCRREREPPHIRISLHENRSQMASFGCSAGQV